MKRLMFIPVVPLIMLSACNSTAPLNSNLTQNVSANAYLPDDPAYPCQENVNQSAILPPGEYPTSPCKPKPCGKNNVDANAYLPHDPIYTPTPKPCK